MFDNTTPDDEGPGVANAEVGAGQNGGPALQGSKPGATAGMRRQIMRQPKSQTFMLKFDAYCTVPLVFFKLRSEFLADGKR